MIDTLVIAICAVICGAESWDDIAEFGEVKRDWFATFLELPNGIPSHDTFNRVFAAFNPEQFRQAFLNWMRTVLPVLAEQVIALDGKTIRRSYDIWNEKPAIHLVSAWASATGFVLAQTKVEDKSNKITTIPEVLCCLAIKGCLVTLDAMGCQRTIAEQIVSQEGDYVLALKENQETLYVEVNAETHEEMSSRNHFVLVEQNKKSIWIPYSRLLFSDFSICWWNIFPV